MERIQGKQEVEDTSEMAGQELERRALIVR
jgi:hypothetical protein